MNWFYMKPAVVSLRILAQGHSDTGNLLLYEGLLPPFRTPLALPYTFSLHICAFLASFKLG